MKFFYSRRVWQDSSLIICSILTDMMKIMNKKNKYHNPLKINGFKSVLSIYGEDMQRNNKKIKK